MLRPARASSMMRRRYSGAYGGCVRGMGNLLFYFSPIPSTKAGQLQAVAQAQQYIAAGYSWTVDFDLEKFFDRVNHDRLLGQIAKRVGDKRLVKLTRAFLNAGVMENGV